MFERDERDTSGGRSALPSWEDVVPGWRRPLPPDMNILKAH